MATPELVAALKAYVTPGASNVSTADDAFIQACLETAIALVDNRAGVTYAVTGVVPVAPVTVTWTNGYSATFSREGDLVTLTVVPGQDVYEAPNFSLPTWAHVLPTQVLNFYGDNDDASSYWTVSLSGYSQTISLDRTDVLPLPTVSFQYYTPSAPATEPGPVIRVSRVPATVLDRAYIEVASELYNRRSAPNGVSQFTAVDGSAIRIARDPMVAAESTLAPFLKLGFA